MASTRRISFLSAIAAFALAGSLLAAGDPAAARGIGLIRDAEIENTIRLYATPLLKAAELEVEAVSFHIVRGPRLNAFVAGGQRMFITTGLLRHSKDPSEVIGVMAHEIGHIRGGHLARMDAKLRDAGTQALIAQLAGVAIGILSGEGGAAVAVGTAGTQMVERNLYQFSRTQERSADQAGVRLMEQTGQSARGLLHFLEYLSQQDLLAADRQDPYLLTHPLSRDRLLFVEDHVRHSKFSDAPVAAALVMRHLRMVAKLAAFIDPPGVTLRNYPPEDSSLPARYARAVAYYRIPDLAKALPAIDALIAERPDDPYFRELKGQMLFENGRLAEALAPYEAAVRLKPDSALLRAGLAHVQLEHNRPDLVGPALANIKEALRTDPDNATAWRHAATAYGRNGEFGLSALSQAEYSLRVGRPGDARGQAVRAARLLKRGSPAWLRAEDIIAQLNTKN